jgi:hypothetical protein
MCQLVKENNSNREPDMPMMRHDNGLIEISELEQFEGNIEQELKPEDEVAPPKFP